MTTIRGIIADNGSVALSLGGFVIGLAFGAIVYRTNFCAMGSISDMVVFGDARRFRAWVLAIATAVVGAQALDFAGITELSSSMYLTPRVNWSGHMAGGLMFGFGMVFAGGCASRNLTRIGGGDMRSLMALIVLGIFAYMAIGGLIGPPRAWLERVTAVEVAAWGASHEGLNELLRAQFSLTPEISALMASAAVVVPALAFCLINRRFRTSRVHVVSGLGVGLCITAGWALTGLAYDEMAVRPAPPVSLTYVRPIGDTLEWAQRFTALGWPGFGVGTVLGAILGAFVTARLMGRFKITTFSDKGDTLRVLGGAALMGVGGVMAIGCTVGQGITAISTLALGSFITFAAIVIGGVIGVKTFERLQAVKN